MQTDFTHRTKIRVRYGETDQMGYCYYGNYASYFEVGRVEALRSLGMSYRKLEEDGVMLPVSHFEIDYHRPAFYDDELTIETKISACRGPRLFFDYTVYNEKNDKLCTAKTTLVFVSKSTMRPITPPQEFTHILMNYAIDQEL